MQDPDLLMRLVDQTMIATDTTLAGPAGSLLERDGALSALTETFATVRMTKQGRLVLLSGEAGVGKTTLLRRFCDDARTVRSASSGAAATRSSRRGRSGRCSRSRRTPAASSSDARRERRAAARGRRGARARAERERPPSSFSRTCTGPTRRRSTSSGCSPGGSRPCRRWSSPATATTSSTARIRFGSCSASSRRAPASRGCKLEPLSPTRSRSSPSRTASTRTSSTARRPATRSSSSRRSPRRPARSRTRSAMPCSRAPRALSPPARTLLEAVAVVPPQAELWLLEALAGDDDRALDECLASGMLASDGDRRRVPARARAPRGRGVGRAAPEARAAPRGARSARRPAGRRTDLARLAHHAEAAGDAEAVLRFAPRPPSGRRRSARTARPPRSTRGRSASATGSRRAERAELLERALDECYLTDQNDEAIEAIEEALECRRELGDSAATRATRCAGSRRSSGARAGRPRPSARPRAPSRCSRSCRRAASSRWPTRTSRTSVARPRGHDGGARLGASARSSSRSGSATTDVAVDALIDDRRVLAGGERRRQLEREPRARAASRPRRSEVAGVATACSTLRRGRPRRHRPARADTSRPASRYCSERGLELYRLYLLAYRARLELDAGRWRSAAETAATVLRDPAHLDDSRGSSRSSCSRLVRARRGDPEVWPLARRGVGAGGADGRAAAHRAGRRGAGRGRLARGPAGRDRGGDRRRARAGAARGVRAWRAESSACWRRRAGVDDDASTATPRAVRARARRRLPSEPRERGRELGCPYEAALALAQADDDAPLRHALAELQRLGARPAAAIVARRLRERGVARPAARAAAGDARQPGRPDRARARGARARRRRAAQRRDRRAAVRLGEDGRPPRLGDPAQARRRRRADAPPPRQLGSGSFPQIGSARAQDGELSP